MKVEFKIDAKKELFLLRKFIEACGEAKVPKEYLALLSKDKKEAIKFIEEQYKVNKTNEFLEQIKSHWSKIEKEFHENITKITGYKWKAKYSCYLTLSVPGFAYLDDRLDSVAIGQLYPIPWFGKIYVLGHELFHLHYWGIIKKEKLSKKFYEVALAEGVPILVFLEKDINKFWNYINLENTRKSYREVDENIDKMILSWNKRNNFKDFLIEVNNKV